MDNKKEPKWISTKQLTEATGLSPTTINRYKEAFPEFIRYRQISGQMLEYDDRCIVVLRRIYSLYSDRSQGRRTTEKVRDILFDEYNESEAEIIDSDFINISPENEGEITTSSTPPQDRGEVVHYNALIAYLQEQDKRLKTLEEQNNLILKQQDTILENQQTMQENMNQRLNNISEIARSRMEERQKEQTKGFWARLFNKEKT